eukprot:CAMPEP_0204603680 /NCGR_PEP_ID=MMETSP0661-20131031/57411_1 /ASSEMBLY_ACC=CAM_ASM_000606 /TAXON_ID=109239 /ORGANISM="Alexandrium margalefi, Strain AMGDE01CS-322" /LENGTH=44 /DNA_ID= /DNA_START= /DNA_END= /DNA_ORIENTATION=
MQQKMGQGHREPFCTTGEWPVENHGRLGMSHDGQEVMTSSRTNR